jgi:RimJ/RimL family protein N-acetyltransferase
MVHLETDRLIIRNFRPDDWQELQQLAIWYRGSPWSQYDHPWPTSEEEVKGMASWFAEGDGYLAACLKATGELMGLISIARRGDQSGAVHGLGYVFHADYHGKGYASEGCRAAMAYVFETLKADRILTGTHPDNTPSVRLLARLGLREVEPGEYTITREAWLARI